MTKRRHVHMPTLGRFAPPLGSDFVAVEATSAAVLVVAVVAALVWANSPWASTYQSAWGYPLTIGAGSFAIANTLSHWVNEGLMAVFFFVIGLELKRELVFGELRHPRAAALPVLGALGGMAVPALIYLTFTAGTAASRGWAIPMATDTAFAVGLLALLGSTIPRNLKVLLLSLAIVDDLGAILVISFFYSTRLHAFWALAATGVVVLIVALRRVGVSHALVYLPIAGALWVCIFEAGFHATVAGVILGLLTPARTAGRRDVLQELEHKVHPWTGLLVVPVFALANAGITLDAHSLAGVGSRVSLGIALGLVVGKFAGILTATLVPLRLGLARLPQGLTAVDLVGIAALAGIGFSVSLVIAELALDNRALAHAKLGIILGSTISAALGATLLRHRARLRSPEPLVPERRGPLHSNPSPSKPRTDLYAVRKCE